MKKKICLILLAIIAFIILATCRINLSENFVSGTYKTYKADHAENKEIANQEFKKALMACENLEKDERHECKRMVRDTKNEIKEISRQAKKAYKKSKTNSDVYNEFPTPLDAYNRPINQIHGVGPDGIIMPTSNDPGYSWPLHSTSQASGIPLSQIPPGDEELYILKSQIVPPVCPACPMSCPTGGYNNKPCPPCPPCARCPEPAFECKKVPNYNTNDSRYLPRPLLNDFSQFGM